MGAKPGEDGVSESPGRGGDNCRLNVPPTHAQAHTCLHACTRTLSVQRLDSRTQSFPEFINNCSVLLRLISQRSALTRGGSLKGLGGPSGAQRPQSPPPGCQVLPIRVPRWTLRPCTRLERLRHSCGKTEEEAGEEGAGAGGVRPQESRVPVRKPPPARTPRPGSHLSSTTQGASSSPSPGHQGFREGRAWGPGGKNRSRGPQRRGP